jgi:hypothetical protein
MHPRLQVLYNAWRICLPYLPSLYSVSIIAFAIATVLPLTVWEYGGDTMFQYVGMQCFASQFWEGNLYPRWCFDANAGLGAPVFVYYPPLPFYVAALFYPLVWAGLSIKGLYLLCLLIVTMVTGFTAFRWLSSLTTVPVRALFLTLVYLWLPYRMELQMFRAAYGELWCMAFLPLVFMASRRIVQGDRKAIRLLAISLALCFLSNMPAAVIGVLASGAYVALMAGKTHWKRISDYALGFVWAVIMAGFYLGPAIIYKPYITTEGVISGQRSWSNDYVSMANVTEHGQGHVVIAIMVSLMALAGMIGFCIWHRARLTDGLLQREWRIWAGMALVSVFMLFPASAFIWNQLGFISMLAFPWRMQLVIAFALMYLAFVIVDQILPQLRPKARPGDIVMPFGMLGLMALFVISAPVPDFMKYGRDMFESQYITQREYRTIWTDKEYIDRDYILWRWANRGMIPNSEPIEGNVSVTVSRWSDGRVELDVNAYEDSMARLALQYFPMWQWEAQPHMPVVMRPEKASGQILVSLPKGRYQLIVTPRIYALSFWTITGFYVGSIAAFAAWLFWPKFLRPWICRRMKGHII